MLKTANQLKARALSWARALKQDVVAVYFAARDKRTPTLARCLAFLTAAYALSPIDLIPDFIPIIGYLDDLVLVPMGIYFTLKMLPKPVLNDARYKAKQLSQKPKSYTTAFVIVLLWLTLISLLALHWLLKT